MAGSQSSVMHMSSVAELYGLSYVVQTLKVRILHLGLVIHRGSSIRIASTHCNHYTTELLKFKGGKISYEKNVVIGGIVAAIIVSFFRFFGERLVESGSFLA